MEKNAPTTTGNRSRDRSPLMNLRDEIDELLENFGMNDLFGPARNTPGGMRRSSGNTRSGIITNIPALDVIDKEGEIKLVADLPGMAENDIKVEVANGMLTISGEKRDEYEEGEKESDYYLCERSFGSFERSIRLPDGTDSDKVEATVRNGVLTVTVPKKPEARHPKKTVKVKSV